MDSKFNKFINENKWFVVFYLIWAFIHLILFFSSDADRSGFWPFRTKARLDAYDFLELFVYLGLPLIVFVIWKLVGKDIKKAIDEKN